MLTIRLSRLFQARALGGSRWCFIRFRTGALSVFIELKPFVEIWVRGPLQLSRESPPQRPTAF
jgi:hypothetical protein